MTDPASRPTGQDTDQELLRQFGDPAQRHKAFERIVRKYQERVYYHIRRMVVDHDDADDVIQNTFIKAWNGLDKYRGDAQLFTWLYRIATNESITFLNRKKAERRVSLDDAGPAAAPADDPLFRGDRIERMLQAAIATLPEKQRLVFNLRYFDGMKYGEMSEVLDTSVGALKASYHHAVKKVGDFLRRH